VDVVLTALLFFKTAVSGPPHLSRRIPAAVYGPPYTGRFPAPGGL